MRLCGPPANEALTGDQRGYLLSRFDVGLRQQVRVRPEHGLGAVADPGGDDVERDAVRQRQGRVGVAERVKRPGRQARRVPVLRERLGQRRRVLRQRQRTDGARDLELEELALRAEEAELKTRRSSPRERATAVIGKGA
jgi:hypothetical protein